MAASQSSLERRLTGYWKVELTNIVTAPAGVIAIGWMVGATPGPLTVAGVLPNMLLLAVGGLYWRAKLHRLQGRPDTMVGFLPIAERCRVPAAALTALALVAVLIAWLPVGPSGTRGDRVLGSIFAVMAVAEYVNYYWRQLQHFDHWADLQRLLRGQGFRPAHLAKDLARWREDQ